MPRKSSEISGGGGQKKIVGGPQSEWRGKKLWGWARPPDETTKQHLPPL